MKMDAATTVNKQKKKVKRKRPWRKEFQRNWPLYVLLLPALVCVIIFNYAPMGGLVMAFHNYKLCIGILGSEFIGLENFGLIFEFPELYLVIINTIYIVYFII